MNARRDSLGLRLIGSGALAIGLWAYAIAAPVLLPLKLPSWPPRFHAEAIICCFLALLGCVVLIPVFFKGSVAQRFLATALVLVLVLYLCGGYMDAIIRLLRDAR
jgi:hypothetical protein